MEDISFIPIEDKHNISQMTDIFEENDKNEINQKDYQDLEFLLNMLENDNEKEIKKINNNISKIEKSIKLNESNLFYTK